MSASRSNEIPTRTSTLDLYMKTLNSRLPAGAPRRRDRGGAGGGIDAWLTKTCGRPKLARELTPPAIRHVAVPARGRARVPVLVAALRRRSETLRMLSVVWTGGASSRTSRAGTPARHHTGRSVSAAITRSARA